MPVGRRTIAAVSGFGRHLRRRHSSGRTDRSWIAAFIGVLIVGRIELQADGKPQSDERGAEV